MMLTMLIKLPRGQPQAANSANRAASEAHRRWLSGASCNLQPSSVFEVKMTENMWRQGYGPQLGCLMRLGERLEAAGALLAKCHMAAAYNGAGGSG